MVQDSAERMIDKLAQRFGPRPLLRWTERATRGKANYHKNTISVGPHVWRGPVPSLLHEYAHILLYYRRGSIPRTKKTWRHHGPEYVETLFEVAEYWYGNPYRYPWHSEYRSIEKRVNGSKIRSYRLV